MIICMNTDIYPCYIVLLSISIFCIGLHNKNGKIFFFFSFSRKNERKRQLTISPTFFFSFILYSLCVSSIKKHSIYSNYVVKKKKKKRTFENLFSSSFSSSSSSSSASSSFYYSRHFDSLFFLFLV